jgi:hypothetical protein
MTTHRRPNRGDWLAGVVVGALLGFVFLGVGSRLGMTVIAIAESVAPSFTFGGSLVVVALGTLTGAVVAVLFLASRAAFPHHRLARTLLFWGLVSAFVWRGLNPVTALKVVVFAPVFLLHGGLLTLYWCRVRLSNDRILQRLTRPWRSRRPASLSSTVH